MHISAINLINNHALVKSNPKFEGNKKSFYNTLVNNHVNHKNNPQEHEEDTALGLKIEKFNEKLDELKKELKQTTDINKRKQLEKNIEGIEQEKSLAVNTLTERHLKFALLLANEFRYLPLSFDELFSSASLGIFKAAEKFSPSKHPGVHFLSYAKFWSKQQIFIDAAKNKQVRIPLALAHIKNNILKAKEILENNLGREPSEKEIANYLNISQNKVLKYIIMKSIKYLTT